MLNMCRSFLWSLLLILALSSLLSSGPYSIVAAPCKVLREIALIQWRTYYSALQVERQRATRRDLSLQTQRATGKELPRDDCNEDVVRGVRVVIRNFTEDRAMDLAVGLDEAMVGQEELCVSALRKTREDLQMWTVELNHLASHVTRAEEDCTSLVWAHIVALLADAAHLREPKVEREACSSLLQLCKL